MQRVGLKLSLAVLALALIASACGSAAVIRKAPGTKHAPAAKTATPSITTTQSVNRVEHLVQPVLPLRLIIPAIRINALIETVGVVADGDLATPGQHPWDDAGWYDMGPLPGQQGSAVIDGHLDRPGGYPAVFWNLRYLQVGDDVQVTNTAGKTLHFRVTSVAYYTPTQAPIQDIFGNLGGTYLNLITCAGDWIPSQHQTTMRLVVYTTLA